MLNQPATLEAILDAKEKRALKQQALLRRFPLGVVLSLSINIPGAIKLSCESIVVHEHALRAINALLSKNKIAMAYEESLSTHAGIESLIVCYADATSLKQSLCVVENDHPLGRFMDIDVITSDGILSREAFSFPRRRCFVCDDDAKLCARSQKHTYEALQQHIQKRVYTHAFEDVVAFWAALAMQTEVELTPKPGLVDRHNTGAHHDMDISTFYVSIATIKPFVASFVRVGKAHALMDALRCFELLREVGVQCEDAMFTATKGVNTHKGMIFCLAVVCGALGRLQQRGIPLLASSLQQEIQALCAHLVVHDLASKTPQTAGERFYHETKSTGIRGIAQSGFAVVFEQSLPFFQQMSSLHPEDVALKKTLLLLMSQLDDSTLWKRGGVKGLSYVQTHAQKLLEEPSSSLDEALFALDNAMIEKNLSAGGSADLLALTWFLAHMLEKERLFT